MSHHAPPDGPLWPIGSVAAVMMQVVPPGIKTYSTVWALLSSWSIPSLASRGGTARRESKTTRTLCVVLFCWGGYFKAQSFRSWILLDLWIRRRVRVLWAPSHQSEALLWKQVSNPTLCPLMCCGLSGCQCGDSCGLRGRDQPGRFGIRFLVNFRWFCAGLRWLKWPFAAVM